MHCWWSVDDNLQHVDGAAPRDAAPHNTPASSIKRSVILVALFAFEGRAADEIASFEKSDRLVQVKIINDDWISVRKAGTTESGLAPASYLCRADSNRDVVDAMSAAQQEPPPCHDKPKTRSCAFSQPARMANDRASTARLL